MIKEPQAVTEKMKGSPWRRKKMMDKSHSESIKHKLVKNRSMIFFS